MGRDPLVVEGPGERSEPLDELGWLPPGEMVGLELLRLNRRMAAGWSRQAGKRTGRQAGAECRQRRKRGAVLAALQQSRGRLDLEDRHGLSRRAEAIHAVQ